jgi:hypothetical protein
MQRSSIKKKDTSSVDSPKDLKLQETIRNRSNYSLAVLGMAFVRNGSGRFLNIRTTQGEFAHRRPNVSKHK